jgi:hypothetical protein
MRAKAERAKADEQAELVRAVAACHGGVEPRTWSEQDRKAAHNAAVWHALRNQ